MASFPPPSPPFRVMGLDPGLLKTGWGVICYHHDATFSCEGYGVIQNKPSTSLTQRLHFLHENLCQLIKDYTPHEAVVEKIFVNKNPSSTLKLGMARGVCLLVPGLFKIPVWEYNATAVKKSITGNGHATKHDVSSMVCRYFSQAVPEQLDANDALALGLCHVYHKDTLYPTTNTVL